jgi:NAD(P)-dependent dehydrogenase (short-subunit alcohol dehydrogenase family)
LLAGRVAVVTGGATGIGAAVSRALAEAGARVVVTHRGSSQTQPQVDAICAEIAADAVLLEVRDVASIQSAFETIASRMGRVDILVNSAGTNTPMNALDVDEQTWDRIVDTNLKGLFFCCQAAARIMCSQPRDHEEQSAIVNVASQMGLVGWARRSVYCASKAGVVNLTRALAVEWATQRIRVNAVAPTFVQTALAGPMLADPEFRAEVAARIPLGTIGVPEDVSGGVLYLASDAARLVTGHTLAIDGGWTAW